MKGHKIMDIEKKEQVERRNKIFMLVAVAVVLVSVIVYGIYLSSTQEIELMPVDVIEDPIVEPDEPIVFPETNLDSKGYIPTESEQQEVIDVVADVPKPTVPDAPELDQEKPLTEAERQALLPTEPPKEGEPTEIALPTPTQSPQPEYKQIPTITSTPDPNKVEVVESPPTQTETPSSKLVPDSQNPFLNPANAATPVIIDSADVSDYKSGTGDKF